MELYSRAISPFAARVRISIAAKNLDVRVIESPDVSAEAYGRLHPWRRVPVLVLDDGSALAESEVIVEYLEDCYPQRPLLPSDPVQRARTRLVARAAELYVFPAVVDLFKTRDPQGRAQLAPALEDSLSALDSLLDARPASWHVSGNSLSLADGALAPFLTYVELLGRSLGRNLLEPCPRLARFWQGAAQDGILSRVSQEIMHALAAARR